MNTIYTDKYVLRNIEQWDELFNDLPQGSNINGLSKDIVKNGILVNQDSDNSYYIVTIGKEKYRMERCFIEQYFIKTQD